MSVVDATASVVPPAAHRRVEDNNDGRWRDSDRRRRNDKTRESETAPSVGAGGSATFDDDLERYGPCLWTLDDDVTTIGVTDRTPLLSTPNRQIANGGSDDDDVAVDRDWIQERTDG